MSEHVRAISEAITAEFQSRSFAKEAFPMLTDWGVEDFSLTIHSLGCNYLSSLGRENGYWSMSEYPVRVTKPGGGNSIRPDTVWWTRPDRNVALLGEFERYVPGQELKLMEKARNLVQTHHELGDQPRVLILLAWAMAGTNLNNLKSVRSVAHDGFRTSNGLVVRGIGSKSTFILATAVFGMSAGVHRLLEIKL